jgi:glycosyltransferase involved in cell wall biosynthesis
LAAKVNDACNFRAGFLDPAEPSVRRARRYADDRHATFAALRDWWSRCCAALAGCLIQAGVPYYVTFHGGLFRPALRLGRLKKAGLNFVAEREYLNAALFVHPLSPEEAEVIRRRGVRRSIVVIPNGLPPDAAVHPSDEQCFGGTRAADVLFVGRLVAWKGPMLALRAFRYVQNRAARLVFCGEGFERARVKRAAQHWGIADRVIFAGFLPRDVLLSRVATGGALLHPALHEEAGLCVAEALALGTPAVCLARGGPAEILRQWPLHTPDSCSDRRSRDHSPASGCRCRPISRHSPSGVHGASRLRHVL